MTDDNIRTYPPGNMVLDNLPTESRDASLGRYMDAFGRLERTIQFAITEILQSNYVVLRSVFAVLMTKQSIDLLDAVAQEHLGKEAAARVHKICQKLARRNMRRNHIIHGSWSHVVVVDEKGASQQWVRVYDHANSAMRELLHTDQKAAGMYTFTIPELDRATDHVEEVNQALSTLTAELRYLRFHSQPPEESQSK